MKIKRQPNHSLTSRGEPKNSKNYPISPKSTKNYHRFITDQGMHAISPWGIDDYAASSQYNHREKQGYNKGIDKKMLGPKFEQYHKQKKFSILNERYAENQMESLKERSKTQAFRTEACTPHNYTPIRFKTIVIAHNPQPQSLYHFSVQDFKKQKMSQSKFKSQFQEQKIGEGSEKNELKIRKSKTLVESKANNKDKASLLGNKVNNQNKVAMRTFYNEKDNGLLFFFEAKNKNNLVKREKSIMKIRNIVGKRNPKMATDGLGC